MLPGPAVALRSLLVLALLWYLASLWFANAILLPTPLNVVQALIGLLASGEMVQHVSVSVERLLISLLLACCLAIPTGFLMALNRWAAEVLDPTIELLRPISGIAWIPLGLFIFGIGGTLPIFIMTYAAFFPLLFNTISGVRGVDPKLIAAARTMGVSRATILRRVIAPSALSTILVGLRLSVASGWTAIVAAELIGADQGVGFAIEWYRELLMTSKVLAFIAVIGMIGYAADHLIRAAQRRLSPWSVATEMA